MDIAPLLQELGVDPGAHAGIDLTVHTPIDGSVLATLRSDDAASIAAKVAAAHAAFGAWRCIPAPRRGELVASSERTCAATRPRSGAWSRWSRARSCRKGRVKCRR